MDTDLSHTHSDADDHANFHGDLYPHFHADRDGNIIAYANGVATTIIYGHRRVDKYTATDATAANAGRESGPGEML